MEAKQVPLYEQLEDVPLDARLVIEDSDGMGATILAIGRMCHGAAAALRAAIEEAETPEKRRERVDHIRIRIMQEAYDLADRDDSEGYNSVKVMCSEVLGMIDRLLDERQWQGLTADEIWQCNTTPPGSEVDYHICMAHQNVLDFAEAIEAKLKEKNT